MPSFLFICRKCLILEKEQRVQFAESATQSTSAVYCLFLIFEILRNDRYDVFKPNLDVRINHEKRISYIPIRVLHKGFLFFWFHSIIIPFKMVYFLFFPLASKDKGLQKFEFLACFCRHLFWKAPSYSWISSRHACLYYGYLAAVSHWAAQWHAVHPARTKCSENT